MLFKQLPVRDFMADPFHYTYHIFLVNQLLLKLILQYFIGRWSWSSWNTIWGGRSWEWSNRLTHIGVIGFLSVYKIHPYKKSIISGHSLHKLSAKYYGPFQILRKVGPVAYTLCFLDSIKIHPTVHVSLSKRCFALPAHVSLPLVIDIAHPLYPNPESILQRWLVKKGGKVVAQVLVKWEGLSADDATWESYQALKVRFPDFWSLRTRISSRREVLLY